MGAIPSFAISNPFQSEAKEVAIEKVKSFLQQFHIPGVKSVKVDLDAKVLIAELGAISIQQVAGKVAPAILEKLNVGAAQECFLQILGGDGLQIQEVRFDWIVNLNERPKLQFPALTITCPKAYRLSLILQNTPENPDLPGRAILAISVDSPSEDHTFEVESNLAWKRGNERELQNDDERTKDPAKLPLLQFSLKTGSTGFSLLLLDFDLNFPGLPSFFQLNGQILDGLSLPEGDTFPLQRTPIESVSFPDLDWAVSLNVNLEENEAFTLPFLKKNKDGKASGIAQHLDIKKGEEGITAFLSKSEIHLPLDVAITFGKLSFASSIDLIFNWKDIAFRVEHDSGIKMLTTVEEQVFEFMGLRWRFQGAPSVEKPGKFELFTLVTKDYNYQLQMAPEAKLILEFTKLSEDPISFGVSDLAITANGISITAEVLNQPTKINGIDTKFSFEGTKISIVENKIQDFTLTGSGPLPPALVGDAMVDIMLQFTQDTEGELSLVAGGAKLQKAKLLEAKSTRFSFQIDAIGLQFVHENGYHLFFIMTGAAMFTPARSDQKDGPLSPLSKVKIEFVDCPLTGDVRVLAKHIKFLVELPRPIKFEFLGCFTFEIRALGFVPAAEVFDGDPAMQITGQVMFSAGGHDTKSARADFHGLYIGVPAKGTFVPRISLKELALEINMGAAFRLSGMVSFVDTDKQSGFTGSGLIEIKGLPTINATFAFLRIKREADGNWLRAWFLYLEASRISLEIPVVHLYLREIGLGFGYRYTLASIKAADNSNNIGELLQNLRKLSRTQGNLSSQDAWSTDIELPGQDPRWTIVFRALISQTSASTPIRYNDGAELELACVFLFDAVVAFRSDLTFLMAVRAWMNTNYNDFLENKDEIRNYPLLSGFVHIDPRHKRLLASIATNPDGKLGKHPMLPPFVDQAIKNSQFSITLLIEPGLFHYEMGWPNLLRWTRSVAGILTLEERGGFIFRITRDYVLLGISYISRGKLEFKREIDLGIVGVEVYALAEIAFGGRFIGVSPFNDPLGGMMLYGAIGLEIRVVFNVRFWIDLLFFSKSIHFSLFIGFTASLEIGLHGSSPGIRGQGTISVGAMGRSIRLTIHVGANEEVITQVAEATKQYMNIGLESSDVPANVPGVAASKEMAPRGARAARAEAVLSRDVQPRRAAIATPLNMPGYHAFVIRAEKPGQASLFVLYPKGENSEGEENGFFPVPPPVEDVATGERKAVQSDFSLNIPESTLSQYDIHQFQANPMGGTLESRALGATNDWAVNWNAEVLAPDEAESQQANARSIRVGDMLETCFVKGADGQLRDPDPLPLAVSVVDERVQNPTDDAFEAAVRGAVEQFSGSPYFKRDPNNVYEQNLSAAMSFSTSIYAASGLVDQNDSGDTDAHAQADQLRGVLMSDLLRDFQFFAEKRLRGATLEELAASTQKSVCFQMGVVFEIQSKDSNHPLDLPDWLQAPNVTEAPELHQRLGTEAQASDTESSPIHSFNVDGTSFVHNPPQFRQVRHFTDANTIAITWDLAWNKKPANGGTAAQSDPEHHLQHYQVLRRTLDNSEPDLQYTVKNAAVLHRPEDNNHLIRALQPRFQIVDHFNRESLEDQAALPAGGRSYLYTITPVDFSGKAGRPLSVVATRYPNQAPPVPAESELSIHYKLDPVLFQNWEPVEDTVNGGKFEPTLVRPDKLSIHWVEPSPSKNAPQIAVSEYYLIFRREEVLPVGSYGLDGMVQGGRSRRLPTSNARPLPGDKRVLLHNITRNGLDNQALIPMTDLTEILPQNTWRPDAWTVFFQTVSANGVPSALMPVNLLVQIESTEAGTGVEQRRPAQLEWLPIPLQFPLLPPEDQMAETGMAHFPMPAGAQFDPNFQVEHKQHPAGVRVIRFLFNQGPSSMPGYPLALNAGFDLLQLDADAHTTETFADKNKLAEALQDIQEVQMAPAADMYLLPADTLTTSQWEAWYPSDMLRLRQPGEMIPGASNPWKPWYSWRESQLIWPDWPGRNNADQMVGAHPLLQAILNEIEGKGLRILLNRQIPPPVQPESVRDFLNNTASKNDPYGWGVLQRLGLCVTFSLRDAGSGELIAGASMLQELQNALDNIPNSKAGFWSEAEWRHLFVELLFQPARSIELSEKASSADRLLGIIQLSLRPRVLQTHQYAELTIRGETGKTATLSFNLSENDSVTLLDPLHPERGELQLTPDPPKVAKWTMTIPSTGTQRLLIRAKDALPSIGIEAPFTLSIAAYGVTDERSTYFTAPAFLANDLVQNSEAWLRFKALAEAGNSNKPEDPKIEIPVEADAIKAFLPDFMDWSQRFFMHGADEQTKTGTQNGAWQATAYPRAGSPAYATPDTAGRLRYDHLLEDKWAHNYRFYIRPYGRYDRLWQSLLQSPALSATLQKAAPKSTPDPKGGGLDVVLHRTQAVTAPVVLSSRRLDAPSKPGSPASPGTLWEIIVAQHPEQALLERNVTLFRQLSFRQIAFSLLRRFSYAAMVSDLKNIFGNDDFSGLQALTSMTAPIPQEMPVVPDHVDLRILSSDEQLALSVPQRIGKFSQNALVLQWEGLPFYYEQKLLLVAQTASTVSPINSVIQRDFHYQSPAPQAFLYTSEENGLRKGRLLLPLKRMWDALSPQARQQWAAENPALFENLTYGALPDLEAVYQLAELYGGNIEVQAEYAFDHITETQRGFLKRQLAKRLVPSNPTPLNLITHPLGCYALDIGFDLPLDIPVQNDYSGVTILSPTIHQVQYLANEKALRFHGILTIDDLDNILWNAVPDLIEIRTHILQKKDSDFATPTLRRAFLEEWYSARVISTGVALPDSLQHTLEIRDRIVVPASASFTTAVAQKLAIEPTRLIWKGLLTQNEEADLNSFASSKIPLVYNGVRKSVQQLLLKLRKENRFTTNYDLSKKPVIPDAPANFSIDIQPDGTTWKLAWNKIDIDANPALQLENLKSKLKNQAFANGIDLLKIQLNEFQFSKVISTDSNPPAENILKISISNVAGIPGQISVTWSGPNITPKDLNDLDALSKQGDDSFKSGMAQFISELKGALLNFEALTNIQVTLPVFSVDALNANLGLKVSFDAATREVRWDRSQIEIPDLGFHLKELLLNQDPFLLSALLSIEEQAKARSVATELLPVHLLLGKELLSAAEQEILFQLFSSDDDRAVGLAIQADLLDMLSLEEARDRFISEVRVSTKLTDDQIPPGFSFTDARDVQLVFTGRDTSTLAGLDGSAEWLDQLTKLQFMVNSKPALETPVMIKSSAVPGEIHHLFTPAAAPDKPVFFTHLRWTGALTAADRSQLLGLDLGPAIAEAVQALLMLSDAELTTITLPEGIVTPTQDALPDNLLLGKTTLRYIGWMLREEARALQQANAFKESPPDQAAIRRLYNASQHKLMHNRDFRMMCRRAAAAPSEWVALEALPFETLNF